MTCARRGGSSACASGMLRGPVETRPWREPPTQSSPGGTVSASTGSSISFAAVLGVPMSRR
eukprot:5705539-Alexandrium_andersonii.AAC.1